MVCPVYALKSVLTGFGILNLAVSLIGLGHVLIEVDSNPIGSYLPIPIKAYCIGMIPSVCVAEIVVLWASATLILPIAYAGSLLLFLVSINELVFMIISWKNKSVYMAYVNNMWGDPSWDSLVIKLQDKFQCCGWGENSMYPRDNCENGPNYGFTCDIPIIDWTNTILDAFSLMTTVLFGIHILQIILVLTLVHVERPMEPPAYFL